MAWREPRAGSGDVPAGLNATLVTAPVYPLRARNSCRFPRPTSSPSVLAAGQDAFAVGAERHAEDTACVPLEGEDSWPFSASHTFAVLS